MSMRVGKSNRTQDACLVYTLLLYNQLVYIQEVLKEFICSSVGASTGDIYCGVALLAPQ